MSGRAASYRSEGGRVRRELAFISGICECQDKRGFYLEELARNDVPGEHGTAAAAYRWQVDESHHTISLHQGDRLVFHLRVTPRIPLFPIRMGFPFLSLKGSGLPFLRVMHTNQVSLSTSRVVIPKDSPFLPYGLRLKIASFHWVVDNVVIEDRTPALESHVLRELKGAFGKTPAATRSMDTPFGW